MMARGYAGKILDINLSDGSIETLELDESILRQYVGGRGLAAKILWDRLGSTWQTVDPLGPENILTVLTGPLTGYMTGGRICVSGKSPLTNGIVGSTVGGEFPIELKTAGFDGVLVTGKSDRPVYILVTDDHAEIRDAGELWGMDGKQTIRALTHEVRALLAQANPTYGAWKEPAILYTGPAGETFNRTAAVMQKWSHAAGYGGYGAVMGAQGLKAIVAKGTGPLPEVFDNEAVNAGLRQMWENAFQDGPRLWGTAAGGYRTAYASSSEPIRNWQEEWHDEKSIGADKFARRCWVKRYWSDYNCPRACLKLAVVRAGEFKGAITDDPDYELIASCGPNLGIYDPEAIVYMSTVADDLGFSGINGPNVWAFAAELYQRGILTREDLGGIDLVWGDARAFADLAQLMVRREKIGDVLAEGTYRAALKISEMKGVDILPYAVQFKGMEVGAHGVRSGLDYAGRWPMGYACSTQPGDHTSGASMRPGGEAARALGDVLVYCNISAGFGPAGPGTAIEQLYRAVTGWTMTAEDWADIYGRRIIQIQRAALSLGGPDFVWKAVEDDDNPPRWYEPLPTGPHKGAAPDREECHQIRGEYYQTMGWDERGIPTTEELKKLGLDSVDEALQELRDDR
jgi:aldehyde:ferredoxin oxidoreductase